ncbi:MAG: hypothetical protein E6J15_05755 [Chloroflexi bacterium]|nr:MAG: hypothetical protein E6J15_05755 [Chloroflexota bacterium]
MNRRVVVAIALLVLAAALVCAARPHEATADERIDQITTELRCPVCQGLSVRDSSPPVASWSGVVWLVPIAAIAAGLVLATGRLRSADPLEPVEPSATQVAALRERVAREEAAEG